MTRYAADCKGREMWHPWAQPAIDEFNSSFNARLSQQEDTKPACDQHAVQNYGDFQMSDLAVAVAYIKLLQPMYCETRRKMQCSM